MNFTVSRLQINKLIALEGRLVEFRFYSASFYNTPWIHHVMKYILGISVIIGDHRVDLDPICFHRFDPPETILTIVLSKTHGTFTFASIWRCRIQDRVYHCHLLLLNYEFYLRCIPTYHIIFNNHIIFNKMLLSLDESKHDNSYAKRREFNLNLTCGNSRV